jgi:hypothetical protein
MDNADSTYSDNSDHEINEALHSNLLAAVSQLDCKQRYVLYIFYQLSFVKFTILTAWFISLCLWVICYPRILEAWPTSSLMEVCCWNNGIRVCL